MPKKLFETKAEWSQGLYRQKSTQKVYQALMSTCLDDSHFYEIRFSRYSNANLIAMSINQSINSEVRAAWLTNNKVNRVFLEHLTPEMLSAQTPAGGYTIAQHLADMSSAPKYWTSKLENQKINAIGNLYDETAEEFIAEMDLERIRSVFQEVTDVILKELEDADTSKLVHKSIESYMIHMLVHDAHHRGQILITLKVAGYNIPEEDAVWMPWKS